MRQRRWHLQELAEAEEASTAAAQGDLEAAAEAEQMAAVVADGGSS